MEAAESPNAAPPAMLQRAWYCERWQKLPKAGGVDDQPYRTMYQMSVLSNAYHAVRHYRNLSGERIHTLTDSQRRILRGLRDLGVWNG